MYDIVAEHPVSSQVAVGFVLLFEMYYVLNWIMTVALPVFVICLQMVFLIAVTLDRPPVIWNSLQYVKKS